MGWIGRYARKHGLVILIVCVLSAIPAAFLARQVGFDTDFSSVFAHDDPIVADFKYFSENFGVTDVLILSPREPGTGTHDAMGDLAERLRTLPYFARVELQGPVGKAKRTLVFAYPLQPCTDQEFCRAMLGDVREEITTLGEPVEWTGAPPAIMEANARLWEDMGRTGLVAMALLVAILVFTLGDPLLPVVALVPLMIAVTWTVAVAHISREQVSLMAACLPTALLGIGVDYTLHLRAGRQEFPGGEPMSAWEGVFRRIGPPLFVGAVTTATAFLALLLSDLRGFHDMGVFGFLGLTLCFVSTILLVPFLSDLRDKVGFSFKTFSMAWLVRLTHGITQYRYYVMAAFAVVTVPLLISALGMRMETSPEAYEDPTVPSIALRTRLSREIGQGIQPILIATRDLKAERRVLKEVRRHMADNGPIKFVDSLAQQFDYLRKSPDISRYKGKDGSLCMILFPRDNLFEGDHLYATLAVVDEIVEACGDDIVAYTAGAILYRRMLKLLRADMIRTAVGAGVIVIAVFLLLVRRVRYLLASFAPLAGGIIWMLGIVRLLGYRFTAANGVAMPLLMGLGIDYGVHIVHRLRHGSIEMAMTTTGRAVLVSGLTTAGAFFSLWTAGNRAVAAMGVATGAGIASCLVWSLLFLPAVVGRRQEQEH